MYRGFARAVDDNGPQAPPAYQLYFSPATLVDAAFLSVAVLEYDADFANVASKATESVLQTTRGEPLEVWSGRFLAKTVLDVHGIASLHP